MRLRIAVFCGPAYATRLDEGAGEYAARVLFGRRDVDGAFVLLDAMLALGTRAQRSHNGSKNGNGHVSQGFNGNGAPAFNGNGAHAANGNGGRPDSAAVRGARVPFGFSRRACRLRRPASGTGPALCPGARS